MVEWELGLKKYGVSFLGAISAGHKNFGFLSAYFNRGDIAPRFMPYHIRLWVLTMDLLQKMCRLILTCSWAPVFKASSNSGLPIARITLPTTDVSQPYQMFFFLRCLSQNLAHVEFVMSWRRSKNNLEGCLAEKH